MRVEGTDFVFDLKRPEGDLIADLRLPLPGRHNVENAVAAAAVTLEAGGTEEKLRSGLASFRGIGRRFEIVLNEAGGPVVIDDYAHHPTELEAAIGAARELFPERRITGVFQPHLFSRTRDFVDGFAGALDKLDEVVLLPIYPAREEPLPGVTSRLLLDKIYRAEKCLLEPEEVVEHLKNRGADVVLILGAGDIDQLVEPIAETLKTTVNHG